MIPKECKRLAEVDFPIAEVSRHAAREKVDPARASVDSASVVGAPAARVVARGAVGVAAAGSVRSAVPGGLQVEGAGHSMGSFGSRR